MGSSLYNTVLRSERSFSKGYSTKTSAELFTQIAERKIHDKMDPKAIKIREARDSVVHPNSFPIILALDVTGSMRHIPHWFLKEGLPNIMGKIIQAGFPDPALMLMAIGDSECDQAPLQVAEFESGDAELDMWLERVWPEGGGGGNTGESYLLAWYVAAFKTVTDSFEKRGKKGILITIGDEPCLRSVSSRELKEFIEPQQKSYSDAELLALAQEKWDVYHLHIMEGSAGARSLSYWKELLNQKCITVDNHITCDKVIVDLVLNSVGEFISSANLNSNPLEFEEEPVDIL